MAPLPSEVGKECVVTTKRESPAHSVSISDEEVETQIRKSFEQNYELLRQEGGHVLAEATKEQALQQALHYWRKLKAIASSVTETEVRLSLPGEETPGCRKFVIEGVVDIVREGGKVLMYDLKTHEDRDIRAEPKPYMDQLTCMHTSGRVSAGNSSMAPRSLRMRLPLEVARSGS